MAQISWRYEGCGRGVRWVAAKHGWVKPVPAKAAQAGKSVVRPDMVITVPK